MTQQADSMDILASIFFVVAGIWLVLAIVYSVIMFVFLRMRRRGELDSVYHEEFGRCYLCGSRRYYISFGSLFRRILTQLTDDPSQNTGNSKKMSRDERRAAISLLLEKSASTEIVSLPSSSTASATSEETHASSVSEKKLEEEEVDADEEAGKFNHMCSICLSDYKDDECVLSSSTCSHQFHKECILDWLERNGKIECPCCRVPMVDENDVWNKVKRLRKEKRRQKSTERKAWFQKKKCSNTNGAKDINNNEERESSQPVPFGVDEGQTESFDNSDTDLGDEAPPTELSSSDEECPENI